MPYEPAAGDRVYVAPYGLGRLRNRVRRRGPFGAPIHDQCYVDFDSYGSGTFLMPLHRLRPTVATEIVHALRVQKG